MNKQELIDAVAQKTKDTKVNVKSMIDAFVETVEETMAKGEKIALVGFGTWEVCERAARKGRNPQTGESISIPAKKVVRFKVAKKLKDIVN